MPRNSTEEATDDAMLVERMGGKKVKMVLGSYGNIKVATSEDFKALAATIVTAMT